MLHRTEQGSSAPDLEPTTERPQQFGDEHGEDRRADRSDALGIVAIVAAATVFYVAPWPFAYVPALAVVAVIAWWRLDLGLIIVPLFVPYFMQPKHFGHVELAPSEIFILLDTLVALSYLALGRWALREVRDRISGAFLLPAGLLLLAATLSVVFAADRHVALREYREVVLEPLAYFGLLLVTLRSLRQWSLVLVAVVASGVVVGTIAIGQFVTHTDLTQTPGTTINRVHALYGSPDNVGLLFDRVVPIWLALGLASAPGDLARRRKDGTGWWVSLVLWVLAGLVLGSALFLTFSRGAWFAIAAAAVFMFAVAFPWGRWLALACVVAAFVAVVVAGPRLEHAFRAGHANTVQRRLDLWRSSITMIRNRPIFGVGPDNFLRYYAPTRQQDRWQRECAPGLGYMQPGAGAEPCLSHPHDVVLDFWLSAGILGLAAFVWLQAVFWRLAVRAWRITQSSGQWLVLGVMGAMLAALVHGLVDQSYFLMDLSVLFWILCGFVAWAGTRQALNRRLAE